MVSAVDGDDAQTAVISAADDAAAFALAHARIDRPSDEDRGTTPAPQAAPPHRVRLLLAHGAGAPMDSAFMEQFVTSAVACGIEVTRFEFAYMHARRDDGRKRPPPRIDNLFPIFARIAAQWCAGDDVDGTVSLIGGKSMGGRIATHVASDVEHLPTRVRGVVCLGYPFHPQGKPETLRIEHLPELVRPTLIVQGDRDPFGSRDEVRGYDIGEKAEVVWLDDGDHDFGPRGRSGATRKGNIAQAAEAVATFADRLGG
ncbi:MAG: alpha/beta family hydrolase [Pseudomonadota bacterium]